MDTDRYKTVAEWYKQMKAEGYSIPLVLCYTLDRMVKERKISFSQAFDELTAKNRIFLVNKTFVFDLNEKTQK